MDSFVAVCAFVLLVEKIPPGEGTTWSCDFETSDLCGYTQDTTDGLDWTRHLGRPPTSGTGPSVDHTLGTGYYMYLETSLGTPGEAARLVSTPFPASSVPYCLTFYYHMFGDSMGTLNVYTREQSILGTSVWSVSGNQGNVWKFGHAQLDRNSSFNIVFEAVRGNGFRGDIAIDDVTVSDECVPKTTTVLPTTTPYPLASPPCTFEVSSICGYRQDIHDSAEWTWHQGQTDTSLTGPGFDHTLGTVLGHYMYFEASGFVSVVTARLLSPTLPIIPSSSNHTSYCLTFWYHMYGLHIGTLNVKQKEGEGSEVPIWSISDEQGNTWRQGQLPLESTTESTVVFEAVRGSSYKGDIAIDDVDVVSYMGQCEFIPSSAMVPLPSTSTTPSTSTSAYLSTLGTLSTTTATEQPPTAMWTETLASSTTDRIPSNTTVNVVPPTPTNTAQSSSTSAYLLTSGTLSTATTSETVSTAMKIEKSSTTDRISPATPATVIPPTPTTTAQSSSTSAFVSSSDNNKGQSSTGMSTEKQSTIVTIRTRPSSTTHRPTTLQTTLLTNGIGKTSTATSTETSNTTVTIATKPSSPTDRLTTLQTGSLTNSVKTTSAWTSTIMSTETSPKIVEMLTGPVLTTATPRLL